MSELEKYLESLKFSSASIKRIMKNEDITLAKEETVIDHASKNIAGFLDYGFSLKDIMIIINKNPRCLTINFHTILEILEYLESLGISKQKITKMIKLCPKIFDRNATSIKARLEEITSLGYTMDEVIKMFSMASVIEELSINKLRMVIKNLQDLGFTEEEVKHITVTFSPIFGFSTAKVSKMVNYLESISLKDAVLRNPAILMQSVAKTHARYTFLKNERNMVITMESYNRLFTTTKRFKKFHGVDDDYLLKNYPLNEIERNVS